MLYELTIAQMQEWFDTFNRDYFNGGLPCPRFAISKSRTRLGYMACKRRKQMLKIEYYDYSIHLSKYYDQTEKQYQNVLLHEMIHYSITYTKLKDTSPHGVIFRGMMDALNRKYGWNITVTTLMKDVSATVAAPEKERLILAIRMQDGHNYLSVVNPRYAGRLNSELKHLRDVKTFGWYKSADTYFSTFPTVRSLRGRRVASNEFYDVTARINRLSIK